eukprot:15448223-Alexandrium_andersonii.AAC.1
MRQGVAPPAAVSGNSSKGWACNRMGEIVLGAGIPKPVATGQLPPPSLCVSFLSYLRWHPETL